MADTTVDLLVTTISNTPSTTGSFTISSAAARASSAPSHVTFGASHDGLTFKARIHEPSTGAWELRKGCTYTHSGTTLSRGTLEASSTGSAIDFTSAAIVAVVLTAAQSRKHDAAALEHVAGSDSNTTMAVNTLYVVDMSAWATADRTYTLPATAAVGDRVGVMVTSGNASFELILTAASGDTLNGVAGGTEWSRLFISNEIVVMRCVAANATWVVDNDGRIPCSFHARCTTAATGNESAATLTVPTTLASFVWTADGNVGGCFSTSNSRVTLRRAGTWNVAGVYQSYQFVSDQQYASLSLWDGTNAVAFAQVASSGTQVAYVSGAGAGWPGGVGAYVEYLFRSQAGSIRISTGSRFGGVEIL